MIESDMVITYTQGKILKKKNQNGQQEQMFTHYSRKLLKKPRVLKERPSWR